MLSKSYKLVTALLLATYVTTGAYAADKVKKEESKEAITVENVTPVRIESIPSTVTNYPLSSLDWVDPSGGLGLSGVTPKRSVHFSIKKDELITDSALLLYYTPSPSLIPVRSQLNVYLNGLLVKTLPIEKVDLGNKVEKEIPLDPRAIGDDNIIEFEFIGHYTDICENPVDSTLWLNIGAASNLRLNKQKLHIANDLANFPVPFFNITTSDKTVLPIVFATVPDESTIKAASIVSSYGGVLTKWRGIDYPVFINSLPDDGNAIVFITNDNRPYFLQEYPKTDVPAIEMADIPSTLTGKMLIVSAPDSEGLVTAAKALAMGNVLFNGPLSKILEYKEIEKRKPIVLGCEVGSLVGLLLIITGHTVGLQILMACCLGIFLTGVTPIVMVLGYETAYPVSEGTTESLMQLGANGWGLICLAAVNGVFHGNHMGTMIFFIVGTVVSLILTAMIKEATLKERRIES